MVADTATSLRRGVDLLRTLQSDEALAGGGLGVLRIAELAGLHKSQVSRTLKILGEYGLVDRDPETRAYRLGWALFALASRAGDTRLLVAGEPLLRQLVRTLDERSYLSVLRGAEVLTVISESPSHAIQATGWAGQLVPAYCTSAGRALLLDHSRQDVLELFADVELVRLGPNSPATPAELYGRIEETRELGYALVDEEFESGLVAAAAPVRDFRGRIVAALNVSGPKFRLGARLEESGAAVAEAARSLSVLLGSEFAGVEADAG